MYALSRTRITQNGIVYLVPCLLLPYLDEIKTMLTTNSVNTIFLEVATRHNIELLITAMTPKRVCRTVRQQPPAAPFPVYTAQPVDFFILTSYATNYDTGAILPNYRKYTQYARFISTFNVKTESMTYAEMKSITPPLSSLFKGVFPKTAICTSIDDSNIRDFVGIILENYDNKLVFLPCIHDNLLYLFTPLGVKINVFFKSIGCGLDINSSNVLYKYTGSTDLNTTT